MLCDGSTRGALSSWLPPLRRRAGARVRLFCFPYAGGSAASFVDWADRLPATIDLRPAQLPGRWNRMSERPLTSVDAIVANLGAAMQPLLDRPFALFGHSMGALIAFELAHHLRRSGSPLPLRLYVSGRRAPHLEGSGLPAADVPDAELVAYLRGLNGTAPEVLESEELMDLLLVALRADFEVCRQYDYVPRPPLPCPITVFGGLADEESAEDYLERWSVHTTGGCTVLKFPGDHFYFRSTTASLLRILAASLERATDAADATLTKDA